MGSNQITVLSLDISSHERAMGMLPMAYYQISFLSNSSHNPQQNSHRHHLSVRLTAQQLVWWFPCGSFMLLHYLLECRLTSISVVNSEDALMPNIYTKI